MSDTTTAIGERMRAVAYAGHELAAELLDKAQAADDAAAGFFAEPLTVDARGFLGAMARARLCLCAATGEPLVSTAAAQAGARLLGTLRGEA